MVKNDREKKGDGAHLLLRKGQKEETFDLHHEEKNRQSQTGEGGRRCTFNEPEHQVRESGGVKNENRVCRKRDPLNEGT